MRRGRYPGMRVCAAAAMNGSAYGDCSSSRVLKEVMRYTRSTALTTPITLAQPARRTARARG